MKNSYLLSLTIALAVGSLTLSGCAGLGKRAQRTDRSAPLKSLLGEEEPEFVTPRSMVAIWKPSTYEKPGTKSLRGFGGRFYFHNASNEPVKVEGNLTIYGYDDASDGDPSTEGKADRKFVFEASTLQEHYSSSGIGHSYSFWVPWDEVGGMEKTITLIPVFKSASGEIPESQPSTLRLPGKRNKVVASPSDSLYGPGTQVISASGVVSDKPMVQHAGGSVVDGGVVTAEPKPERTTTLRLPRHLAQRIAQATPASKPVAKSNSNESFESDLRSADLRSINEINTVEDSRTKPSARDAGRRGPRPVFGQPGSF